MEILRILMLLFLDILLHVLFIGNMMILHFFCNLFIDLIL